MSRVVVVTGAAGAIGAAVCARFAKAGETVVGLDLASATTAAPATGPSPGVPVAAASPASPPTPTAGTVNTATTAHTVEGASADSLVHMVGCDVSDEVSVGEAFGLIRSAHGDPTVLVNNAGITGSGGIEDEPPQQWRRILDVNLTGAYLCARECVAAMRALGGGWIVNVASVNARFGGSALSGPAYAASKGGLLTLTRFLAREHAAHNIKVNAVAPGPHDTPMWAALDPVLRQRILATVPGPAPGDPDDLAALVEFLCHPNAAYITGATIDVNGGQWMG